MALGVAGYEGAPEYADDLAGFQKRKVQRQFGNAGGEADDQKASFPVQCAHGGLGIVAANAVIDDINAASADRLDLVGEGLLLFA
jgi:hypothetical protein